MREKTIEKIPYFTLPKLIKDKKVRYISITRILEIAGQQHFFLETYQNKKGCKTVPVARLVVTETDFETYLTKNKCWSKAKINSNDYNTGLIWEEEIGRRDYTEISQQNRLYEDADLCRIKQFFGETYINCDRQWWNYINYKQRKIMVERRFKTEKRKYERRQKALEERDTNTPPLEEDKILEWAEKTLFPAKHYLYYKKKGRHAVICCSTCGGISEGAWKHGESYESTYETWVQEPKNKHLGRCKLCGASGVYKTQGTAGSFFTEKRNLFKIDRYRDKGIVVKYIEVSKRWSLDLLLDEKGIEQMNGAKEEMSCTEIARTYLWEKKMQTDFQKYDPYRGRRFWDDCNLSGMSKICIASARIYPGYAEILHGTAYQYCALDIYNKEHPEINVRDYMRTYMNLPQLEMFVKMHLDGIVDSLIRMRWGILASDRADRLDQMLGIDKKWIKTLIESRGDTELLQIMQYEKNMNCNWTKEQLYQLSELKMDGKQIMTGLGIMKIQKLLNLISQYAKCEYGTGCTNATEQLRHVATTYMDYVSMRQQLGYDMSNTVYQRPKNLNAAHQKMVEEIDKEKQDKRLREVAERFPQIQKKYRSLRKKYYFEDDTYVIRPARSAEEIVREGRALHHCVGGDTYLNSHNEGKTYILFLRFKEEQNVPYVTIEIEGEHIRQWYGAHDKKPNEENIKKWLNAYLTRLKCQNTEEREQVLALA